MYETDPQVYLWVSAEHQMHWRFGELPIGEHLVTYEWLNDVFYPVVWEAQTPPQLSQHEWDDAYTSLKDGVITPHYEDGGDGGIYEVDALGNRTLYAIVSHWGRADAIVHALNTVFPRCDQRAFRKQQYAKAERRMHQMLQQLRPTNTPDLITTLPCKE